jgi:predicted DNA-binding antitoxin AbrB/MazE fold protein
MTTAVDAIYEEGVFKPEKPVDLKDKTKVRLVIEPAPEPGDDGDPTGWKTAMELKGCIKGGPPDLAANHDKYLYGTTGE